MEAGPKCDLPLARLMAGFDLLFSGNSCSACFLLFNVWDGMIFLCKYQVSDFFAATEGGVYCGRPMMIMQEIKIVNVQACFFRDGLNYIACVVSAITETTCVHDHAPATAFSAGVEKARTRMPSVCTDATSKFRFPKKFDEALSRARHHSSTQL